MSEPVETTQLQFHIEPDKVRVLAVDTAMVSFSVEQGCLFLSFYQSRLPPTKGPTTPNNADCVARLALTPAVYFTFLQLFANNWNKFHERMAEYAAEQAAQGDVTQHTIVLETPKE